MSTEERLESLEGQTNSLTEKETIIKQFQNPDTCIFCTDEDYDSVFYMVMRYAYFKKIGYEIEKQDKKTCLHHSDEWLKYSLYSAGFVRFAVMGDKKSMLVGEIIDILENKEEREKILTKSYDEQKDYSTACDLYLSRNPDLRNRYKTGGDIERDVPIQNEIVRNKLKIYYTNAIEALKIFDEESS